MDTTPKANETHDDLDLTRPGLRTGHGAWSILPYLNQSLKTRPKAEGDIPAGPRDPGPSGPRDPQP